MRKEGRPGIVFRSLKKRYDSQLLEGKGGWILLGRHILIWFFSCTFFGCLYLTFVVGFFFLVELIHLHKQNFFSYPYMDYKPNLEVCLLGWIDKVDFLHPSTTIVHLAIPPIQQLIFLSQTAETWRLWDPALGEFSACQFSCHHASFQKTGPRL